MKNINWQLFIRRTVPHVATLLLVALMLVAFRVWAMPSPASASIPSVISYQGSLAGASGNLVTGSVDMTFSLYAAPEGGAPLWTESHTGSNAVPVANGLFNALLGSLTPLPLSVWNNSSLYLGVTIESRDGALPS